MSKLSSHCIVGGLLDLPLVDRDGRSCGIVDDIALDGKAGEALRIASLMVGPGAYAGRLPRWAMALVRRVAGDHVRRVPWEAIRTVDSAVRLFGRAEEYGLHLVEDRVRDRIPRKGAL